MKLQCVAARLALVSLTLVGGLSARAAEEPSGTLRTPSASDTPRIQEIQVQGRVVCLAEEMHQTHGTELPTRHQHLWGFKATNGTCYTLLEGKFSEALWHDPRVRAKQLQIKARLLPRSQILEVTYFRSVKNGVLHNLYYYCEICAISSVSPEQCACCQAPVELVEKPLTEPDE